MQLRKPDPKSSFLLARKGAAPARGPGRFSCRAHYGLNVAVQALLAFINTEQLTAVPQGKQSPVQPPNVPVVTVAVRLTLTPSANVGAQVVGQTKEPGFAVIVPTPGALSVRVSVSVLMTGGGAGVGVGVGVGVGTARHVWSHGTITMALFSVSRQSLARLCTVTFTGVETLREPPVGGTHPTWFGDWHVRSGSVKVSVLASTKVVGTSGVQPTLTVINERPPDCWKPEPLIVTVWLLQGVEQTAMLGGTATGTYCCTVLTKPSIRTDVMNGRKAR